MSREINFKKNLKILSYFAKNILTNRLRYNIIIKPCRMTRLTYGGIAQLARAFGSYPECRWFESNCRYQFWPGGQEVKTPPFHGGNTSSILVRVTKYICRCGGIGRHKGLKIPRGKTRTGSSPVSGTRIKALRSSCDLRAFLGYLSTNFFGIKINFECFKHFNMLV